MIPELLPIALPASTEVGELQVMHLKRYWTKSLMKRNNGLATDAFVEEWKLDTTLLSILGLGLEQTTKYVYSEGRSFNEFENWILTVAGTPDPVMVERYNSLFTKATGATLNSDKQIEQVLTSHELEFWQQNGYIIIRNAVSKTDCDDTIRVICDHIGVDRYDASTWYDQHNDRQGIMVQLFQHPILKKNRLSDKIRKVYEQLWGRTDIFVSTDRVGFNPPETDRYQFQGPGLHWDVSLDLPIPFGLQGILYLADTAEDQGAFTLVPGFHHRIDDWVNSLPKDADPRAQDLYALGAKPIAANAGDMIVWHQALPHGSSPNTALSPRFVQYINYSPVDEEKKHIWK